MSTKINAAPKRVQRPGGGKAERYVQPSILLGLNLKPSYGYELIHSIQEFGFVEGQAPPGMIYRHLRQLEEDGLVHSEWETAGTGPAKRMYRLTPEGEEVLAIWIVYMERQVQNLQNFIRLYHRLKSPV
jgi:poly-beta-hydroxybutyrate-responsive repressor